MKNLMSFLFGIVLTIIGVIMFLSNLRVSNYSIFYRVKGTNVTAILLLLMCVLLVACIAYPSFILKLLLGVAFMAFVITVILSLQFYIIHMSGLEIFLILGTFCVGLGLTLRGVLGTEAMEKKERKEKKKD